MHKVGLATVSVLAFWLVVTVVVLSCLLARRTRTSAKPRCIQECSRITVREQRRPARNDMEDATIHILTVSCGPVPNSSLDSGSPVPERENALEEQVEDMRFHKLTLRCGLVARSSTGH